MPVGQNGGGVGHAVSSGNHTLGSFIDRLNRLYDELKNVKEDVKEVYKEAKACGFDPKIMKSVMRYLATSDHEREMAMAGLVTYLNLLGKAPKSLDAAAIGVGGTSGDVEVEASDSE